MARVTKHNHVSPRGDSSISVFSPSGEILPLSAKLSPEGKQYIIALGKHKNGVIVPRDDDDVPMFAEAAQILRGNTLQIVTKENPPRPAEPYVSKGPTVLCDITEFELGGRESPWFVLRIAVPASGEFSLVHGAYTIALREKEGQLVLSMTY